MQDLISVTGSGPLTMSSREIAELCEKEHAHVMRDIRVMLDGLGEGQSKFGSTYLDAQGKERACYLLPKRETLILVSGYSVALRSRIIDRWQQLEAEAATGGFNIPKTLPEALRLAAEQAEKVLALESKVRADQPKVEFYDEFINADGLYTLQNAGRALGCHPNLFCAWLREGGYLFRQDGSLVPYVRWRAQGLFEVKNNICTSDGRARPQSYITPKGVQYFAKLVPDEIRVGVMA